MARTPMDCPNYLEKFMVFELLLACNMDYLHAGLKKVFQEIDGVPEISRLVVRGPR